MFGQENFDAALLDEQVDFFEGESFYDEESSYDSEYEEFEDDFSDIDLDDIFSFEEK